MTTIPRPAWIASIVLTAWVAVPALAQTGGVRVAVLDAATGDPLPGATVTLNHDEGLAAASAALTDALGVAEFPVLRIGRGYQVRAMLPGFAGQRRSEVRVRSGTTTTLEIRLTAPTTEKIEVSAQTPVVDIRSTGSRTRFSDEFIADLPQNGRRYQDVLPKAAGVLDHDEDGNPNVHGARTRDFRAEVGGISNVDPLTGQWLSAINLDSIEELEVLATGAGVEFGRAQGGFARIVQKQGTNVFEGLFGLLYRTSALDGDGGAGITAAKADFKTFQPSIQLSGPVIKDRLWYRLSHEYLDREDPLNLLGQLTVTTTRQQVHADQLSWQVSPRNRLSFQYQNDSFEVDNLGISSAALPETTRTFERGGPTYSLGWLAPFSPRLLFDSSLAYQDHRHDIVPSQPDATQNCIDFVHLSVMNNASCFSLTTNRFSGPHSETSNDRRQRLTARTQATAFARIGNQSHQFKFGINVENERYFRELERSPELTARVLTELELCRLQSPTPPFQGCLPVGNPPFIEFNMTIPAPGATKTEATGNSWAVYFEDQWKPLNNLNVTLGVRLDREEIQARGFSTLTPGDEADQFFEALNGDVPIATFLREVFTVHDDILGYAGAVAETLGISSNQVRLSATMAQAGFWAKTRRLDDIDLVNNNFAPRLAVAWDPWSDGKTKFALTAGRYYDKIFLAVPTVEVEPPVTRSSFIQRTNLGTGQASIRDVTVLPLSTRLVNRDLRTPYQDEFTVALEREIFTETSLRLSFVRRKFRDQLQDVDINHLPADHGRCEVEEFQQGDPDFFDPFQDFSVVPSDGEGATLTDLFTGEQYIDTDPGPGDGRLDDCSGGLLIARVPFQGGERLIETPDGRPDAYVQNPAWEELLLLGNFNESDYRAVVLELVRRLHRNWQMEASYTWSKARGAAEDFDLLLGNEPSLREDEEGFLDYDQRHVVQLNLTTITHGLRLGGSVRWESGLPFSILHNTPVGFIMPPAYPFQRTNAVRPRLRYPTGQRNDQRNPSFWTVDARISRDVRLGKKTQLQLTVEAFNLLDDDTVELDNVVNERRSGTRRFGRRWQLGLRLGF